MKDFDVGSTYELRQDAPMSESIQGSYVVIQPTSLPGSAAADISVSVLRKDKLEPDDKSRDSEKNEVKGSLEAQLVP